ncbi:DUF1295 domain-containing protein [Variovorax dokdonensis]|uniref:DUF1295 domain-containing protein n=1 Tax=Variovorax dokdonensis TaxID=344883 RepID=A0ABT7N983_9BURK|nr:DUF1295 domain-containing protein [Variovorax dokdonensis]MDM0044503.1 DUF1295 domain-containing protein [Variovorax dokdonensis]
MSALVNVALPGLATCLAIAVMVWVASLIRKDVSIVDPFWPVMILAAGVTYALCIEQVSSRGWIALVLAGAWAVRLSLHLAVRKWHDPGEDRRYVAIRERNSPGFGFKSLYLVFALQALLAWVVSAPLGAASASSSGLNLLDIVGVLLAVFGVSFEAIADWQLARFKADPKSRGAVMDQGLWRYSRHPNYFGESCLWWGLGLIALAAGFHNAWALVSPVLVTVLLLKVSGVGLLEADLVEHRKPYRDYIERTPAFFPGRPRASGGKA